ncbi:flagellar biosynthesis protein FlhB [Rhodobacteraceae bacterium]|nr:flagellar biosynthesis protein FlhB [Paracoccaceae bacterium]
MSDQGDESEKEFEATPQKLEQARRKGELVKSADITVAAAFAGVLIAATAMGAPIIMGLGERLMAFLGHADTLSLQLGSGASTIAGGIIAQIVPLILPWFLLPMALVLVALFAQRALVFAPDKLQMKGSRINPLSNAKQKFGRSGLFEFGKSFAKLLLVSIMLGWFLSRHMQRILATQRVDARLATVDLMRLIVEFLFLVTLLAAVMGVVDYIWQRADFMRRQKMTRKELQDEMKSSEGDPHMKQQRRQRGMEIAMGQMMGEVPKADVILVNPTHYAVALKWDRAAGRAPHCVAKGVDEVALKIREVAAEHNVPIQRDPPTARALYASVELDEEIRPEHYKPVAAAIRFAEKMRVKARRAGRR